MYYLTDDQEKEIQDFISKIPDSIVKSQITNLFAEVFPTNRITSEQLEKFMSFQNALPKELQTYPQAMAQWFKNDQSTTKDEAKAGTPTDSKVDFKGIVSDSHAGYKAEENTESDGDDQEQEILHTLNVEGETLAGTKAKPKIAEDKPTYEEKLKSDAKESAKTSGGKPAAQKAEEESIIARNRDVSTAPKKGKPKEVVVKKAAPKKVTVKSAPSKQAKKKR